jgi:hypothetical protein
LTAPHQLLLRELAGDFITNSAGQLFQIDDRASSRQFGRMLAGKLGNHHLHPCF